MAKKSSKTPRRTSPSKTHGVINGAGEVVEQPIVSTIRENYMPYAMSDSLPCNSRNRRIQAVAQKAPVYDVQNGTSERRKNKIGKHCRCNNEAQSSRRRCNL